MLQDVNDLVLFRSTKTSHAFSHFIQGTKVCCNELICEIRVLYMGGFQKNEVFFNIKAGLISFIHIRSHLYLKCVL